MSDGTTPTAMSGALISPTLTASAAARFGINDRAKQSAGANAVGLGISEHSWVGSYI